MTRRDFFLGSLIGWAASKVQQEPKLLPLPEPLQTKEELDAIFEKMAFDARVFGTSMCKRDQYGRITYVNPLNFHV